MKKNVIIILGILLALACEKKDNDQTYESCSKKSQTYSNEQGSSMIINVQKWYLLKNEGGGGSVNLAISGETNADSATIRTYGDGEISNEKMNINNSNFDEDVTISFTATSVPVEKFTSSSVIMVYKDSDTMEIILESCELKY